MSAGDITIDTLMEGFVAVRRHDLAIAQGHRDYAAMMRPYTAKPGRVFTAAHHLATSAAHGVSMHPADAEACFATIREAGMEWGREEPQP